MTDTNEEMRKQLNDFQQLQQQLQMVVYQKQQMALQVQELEKAREELKATAPGPVYRFTGAFFIPKEKTVLEKELEEEKESMELRIKSVEKQEEKLTERLESIKKWFDKAQKGKGDGALLNG